MADHEAEGTAETLLIHSLAKLDASSADRWEATLEDVCDSLAEAHFSPETSRALVEANVILQQFLLELACRPSNGRPRAAVIDEAAALLTATTRAKAPPATCIQTIKEASALLADASCVYRFRNCVVNVCSHTVHVSGQRIHLGPASWCFLLVLLAERHRVVSAEELRMATWGDRPVTGSAVSSTIHLLRRKLGDDGGTQAIIRTVHGRGFRIVADIEEPKPYRPDEKIDPDVN
jgi:DNA-binding winged helix-turn-helix (wHTH) protein